jgi:membrane-bound ClpP family serine protease
MTSILLLFIGLLLIFLEFYLPGGLMAVLGGGFILGSILVFASHSNSILAISLFILGVIAAIALLIQATLKKIVKTKPEYSIYLNKDQEGYQASEFDKSAIGKSGVVLTDLKPGGYIVIDGQQHQAISIEGYIPRGESVIVISGQEESLMVKLKKESHS